MATITRRSPLKSTFAAPGRNALRSARTPRPASASKSRGGSRSKRGAGTRILVTARTAAQRRRLAGEVAAELGRDLLRIDLGRSGGKYIGETEKNLQSLFNDAETTGAVLFFDEADALFGRRTSVKDAHDRYADHEMDYLLSRLERSPAVVILATTAPARINPEFQRRLRLSIKLTRPTPRAKARGKRRTQGKAR